MSLAIDDFGTGYSSLSYLHRFPFSRPVQAAEIDEMLAVLTSAAGQEPRWGLTLHADNR